MKKRVLFSMFLVVMMLLSGSGFTNAQAKAGIPPKPSPYSTPAAKAKPTTKPWGVKPIPVGPVVDSPSVPGELIVGFSPALASADLTVQSQNAASSVGASVLRSGARGMTLMKIPAGADVNSVTANLKKMPGVSYVEPNYTVKLNDPPVNQKKVPSTSYVIRPSKGKDGKTIKETGYPVAGLKASKTKTGSTVSSTYPNDPSLWVNWGWSKVGADIVWNNTTTSKNICEIDTGVDYLHPDLAGKIIKGFDFVNYDADPMDDFGHGTHVAGIIAAVSNNKIGISGVSTGKIVAVKVLDANGSGTSFDVAQGIYYCADRTDINILSMSLGGPASNSTYWAVNYAVNTKNKLLVAAAGNAATKDPTYAYPAAYVLEPGWGDRILAVAAAGQWWPDESGEFYQDCQADYSNYGSWVNFAAPGTDIYSTTPYDKPFTLNNLDGLPTRYGYLSGTSMATPFVAAVAARAWGYMPKAYNYDIESWLYDNGNYLDTNPDDYCWDASMDGARMVNVAASLERGAITLSAVDANTDLPLVGATVSAYWNNSLKGSAVITPGTLIDPDTQQVVGAWFTSWADIINLPAPSGLAYGYLPKITATNYASSAPAFVSPSFDFVGWNTLNGITWTWGGFWGRAWASVPQKSANFSVVGESVASDVFPQLVGWLPSNHAFILNPNYYDDSFGEPDSGPLGSMSQFPYARWLNYDWNYQSIIIRNRSGAAALPWFSGFYDFALTDGANSGDDNGLDNDNAAAFIWKDGVLKYRIDKDGSCGLDRHWWYPFGISSSASGSPFWVYEDACGSGMDY